MTENVRDATVRRLTEAKGWESLSLVPDRDSQREQWAQMFGIAKLCADTFNTAPGQEFLQHLVRTFVARPIVHPADTQFAAGIRQGQADVVLQILQNLEIAKRGTP
jgi:hypothetical protein